ncbi:MAG TPA: carboxypeptidase regulatory-like domain-containing protein [Bryobacteraceae bacterium]|nr:carboxypeptidase regulatory-like domain-containing protein [Bryobacteraceae bacterium]
MFAPTQWKVVLTVCLAIAGFPLAAQVSTGEFSGNVTDASGASVASAKIVATNTQTGITREVLTDAAGGYVLTLLPPGNYNLAAEAGGFRRVVQNGIPLQVNQRAEINFRLEVGQVNETVEVAAAPPLLESESSSLGSVIAEQFVGELPLNGRNFVQLAILSPGVNGTGFSTAGTIMSGTRPDDRRPGTELFSNGNREGSNNFLYDGIDNNDRLTLSIVLRPGVDAIKEFKVQTNLYSADLGRNSGAVVDVVTKSGTNGFHGSAFEFLRNSAMDARNFFSAKGTPFPSFRYNQFGGSFGGPVILPKIYNGKNRTFFFVDYEGYRRTSLTTLTTTVPTVTIRGGDFGATRIFDPLTTQPNPGGSGFLRQQFPNNVIPSSRFDPVTRKLINAYPLPQNSNAFNNYVSNLRQQQNWDQGDVRVDHQFNSNNTFFARWSVQHTSTIIPNTFPAVQIEGLSKPVSIGNEDSFAGTSFSPDQHAVADYVHIFSSRLINDFRVGYNRFVLDYTAEDAAPGANFGNALGVANANSGPQQTVLPIFSPANYAGAGASRSLPIFRRENSFQYVDNVTYTLGEHTLKFGGGITRRQITEYQTNRGNGRFNFSPAFTNLPGVSGTGDTMASFLLGYPSLIEQDFTLAWVGMRGIETGLYFADDWRVGRRLTFNLGFRWDYYSPYSEVANRWANFDADTATVLIAGRNGVSSTAGVDRDLRNFAPRFGFAYRLLNHTVVRGGYGIFYNPNGNGGANLRLERHVPFGPIYSISPGDINVGPRVSDGFPAPPTVNLAAADNPSGSVVGIFPHFKSGYAQQYNLTVEHEIAPWHTIIKAAYVGNLGRRLGTTLNLNQPVPGPTALNTRRPFYSIRPTLADVTYSVSDGLSNYNAFQLTVEKRMSHGLSLLVGYTWGHAIDNVATDFGGGTGTPQDPRNRNADRGNSAYDIRHRFTASYTYLLPLHFRNTAAKLLLGEWQINGITTLQTGLPFTPALQTPTTNCCGSRPDLLRDPNLPSDQRSINRWFDPTAFGTPAPYTYGSAGRDILFGPGRVNFDVSLFKDFLIHEGMKLQFRAESFNVFNTPQFGLPNGSIGNAQAPVISSTVGNPRQMQVALRLQF